VNFVIKRDKKDLFVFASLQSERTKELAIKFKFDTLKLDTFILLKEDKFYTKSTAALMVCKELSSPIKILFPLIIVPKFLRDFLYDMIAKNRYKLFGKRESCRIPTEEDKLKFLN
jgi:predicted DCC family thiol-disulfide oxidoreductase YuxK